MPLGRVVGVIRFLRSVAPARPARRRPLGRIPRPIPPNAIALEYYKALRFVPAACERALASIRPELLELVRQEREEEARRAAIARLDAPGSDRSRRAKALVHRAAAQVADELKPQALHDVAAQFGRRLNAHQRAQFDKQIRAAIGVSLTDVEPHARDLVPTFARANVELVKSIPTRFQDRLHREIEDAFATGMHPTTLAKRFTELDGMADSDAMRLARDQIGKLNAQFTQERQQAIGVLGYTWRGMLDNRERDEHVEREGEHFDWDDPPEDGHPGEPVLCRCWAEPDFGPVLDALE